MVNIIILIDEISSAHCYYWIETKKDQGFKLFNVFKLQ